MSHQIETHANTAAALFARVDPWHRLGTTLEGEAFTAEQAMTCLLYTSPSPRD